MTEEIKKITNLDELMFESFDIKSGQILVIAPLRVAEHTWSTEIKKWDHLKHLDISRVIGSQQQRIKALNTKADIYVINRENVVWLVEHFRDKWSFKTVVVDELSSFKNPQSKRFRALRKVSPFFERFIGLTGTPAPRNLIDLWPQIYLMDRGQRLEKTLTAYRNKYFVAGRHNGFTVYEWLPRDGSEEIIQDKIKDICMSLTAADWLKMPEKIEVKHDIEFSKDLMKRYKEFEKEKVLELEENTVLSANAGVLAGKLTQFTSGAIYTVENEWENIHDLKLDVLEELIEEANGQSVLVFYNFKHDEARIVERLKSYNPRKITCAKDIDDWNSGKIQVLLAHPAAMGHGLNLQQGGHIAIWFSLTWDLEAYLQANARLYRQGQTKAVLIHHLIAKNTVDEDILQRLQKKEAIQNNLIEAVKARMEED